MPTYIWIAVTAANFLLIGLFLRYLYGSSRVHKHIQQANETEKHFRLLIESVKDYAIFSLDIKGHVISWNKGAQNLKGYLPQEIIGRHFSTFYKFEDVNSGFCDFELQEADRTGRFETEGWRVRKDGSEFWANVVISAIRDLDGTLIGFSKVTRDLTESRRTEEQLRHSEAQLKEAQKIAHIGSWEWDIENNFIFWSDEMFQIFGISKENFDPSFEAYLARLEPERRRAIEVAVKEALETGKDYLLEHKITMKDGTTKFVQGRGHCVFDSNGKLVKLSGTAQDITDLKAAEAQLVAHQQELEQKVLDRTSELHAALQREKEAKMDAQSAAQAKSHFLANMSHEIRTPMNAILGFSDLLTSEPLTQEQQDYLSRIKANGSQLLQIIDDILDLSKFEAGKIPLDKSHFALGELIHGVVTSLSSLAQKKGLEIETTKGPGVPQYIFSDSLRLRQILINLVSNAIKFSEKGKIKVHTQIMEVSGKKPGLVIEVVDNGIGISPDNQKILFQPFSQADGSIARKFGGTGLGLILSRHIAQAFKGDLILKSSTLGEGSTFQLYLDLEELESKAVPEKTAIKPIETLASFEELYWHKPICILLAEDSSENEYLVKRYLNFNQVQVDTARNGFEALNLASKKDYDLVLMDIQMPELDGLETTRRLRASGFKRPIIAWTAHAFREDRERSLEAGCTDYLTKPVTRADLVQMIRSTLNIPSAPQPRT